MVSVIVPRLCPQHVQHQGNKNTNMFLSPNMLTVVTIIMLIYIIHMYHLHDNTLCCHISDAPAVMILLPLLVV